MNKRTKQFQVSIKTYILVIFILSIVATVILTGVAITSKISQNARQRIEEGDRWLVSQLCETADYLSGQADNISATLAFDSDIQSALIAYQYGGGEPASLDQVRIWINSNLLYKSRFNNALYDCVNIVLYSNDGEVLGSKETFNQKINIADYEWFELVRRFSWKKYLAAIGI